MVCVYSQVLSSFGEKFTFKQDHTPSSQVSLQSVLLLSLKWNLFSVHCSLSYLSPQSSSSYLWVSFFSPVRRKSHCAHGCMTSDRTDHRCVTTQYHVCTLISELVLLLLLLFSLEARSFHTTWKGAGIQTSCCCWLYEFY